jgi:hypothetical protein
MLLDLKDEDLMFSHFKYESLEIHFAFHDDVLEYLKSLNVILQGKDFPTHEFV